MYAPYFRGKQYELITLREMAPELASRNIIPILEPVKVNHSGLQKCINELRKSNVPFVLVVNPKHGDFKNDNRLLIDKIINNELGQYYNFQVGYLINGNSELSDISSSLLQFGQRKIALIHYGYPEGAALAAELTAKNIKIETNIYIDGHCGKLYQRHFKSLADNKVLIRDGFKKEKNANYPEDETFSELHLIYGEEGVTSFGDFLTVGDDYSESGGPAYAIAIHITYFRDDGVMNIKHFISDRVDSPVDPAGKFLEALQKLIDDVNDGDSLIPRTNAILEFIELHSKGHFPGLGYVKKLSMKHHLEMMINFLNQKK